MDNQLSKQARIVFEWITGLKKSYQRVFDISSGDRDREAVLKDLAIFCRAHKTPFNESQRLTDVLIGRQEVWLRIQQHLQLSDEELYNLYTDQSQGAK